MRGHGIATVSRSAQPVSLETQEKANVYVTHQRHTASLMYGQRKHCNQRTCLMVMLGFHPASSLMMDKQILPLGYTLRAARPVIYVAEL